MKIKRFMTFLMPVDCVSIVFLFFLIALNLFFSDRIAAWKSIVFLDVVIIGFVLVLVYGAGTTQWKWLVTLHRLYSYLFVFFVFKEIYLMVRPIHPVDYDCELISIDKWIFGVNPTQWLAQFAHPLLTEILQIAYFSYYLLFIMLGVEIARRHSLDKFDDGAFLIVYGFYLSYLGYFLLPAVGPRFTLHNFYTINKDLPGLFFTPWIRDFINAGESISFTAANARAMVQRDVFPSGHTALTLIVVYLAHWYKLQARWVMTVIAGLLIISTVYLRYHYVVDLAGGVAFFFFTIWSGKKIQRWWQDRIVHARNI